MPEFVLSDKNPILVEWTERPGQSPRDGHELKDIVGEGTIALHTAMQTIYSVAGQVGETIEHLTANPQQRSLDTVEIEFGIKLDAESGAFIARTSTKSTISVKMTWQRQSNESVQKQDEP